MHHIPGILEIISAGGQGDDPILTTDGHGIGRKIRFVADLLQPLQLYVPSARCVR